MPATPAETDPSVCYRHPDRSSWTLCERCGRTICPECQILTPAGVRCPDCVRETGGSVRWEPAAGAKPRAKKAGMRRGTAARSQPRERREISERLGGAGRFLLPQGGSPVFSIAILAIVVVLLILEFATGLPGRLLTVRYDAPLQVWGYLTSTFVYPAALSAGAIVNFLLISILFVISAPRIEIEYGPRRFLGILFGASAAAAAVMVLSGSYAFGLNSGLFGLFGSYAVVIWHDRRARTQYLIVLGIVLFVDILRQDYQLPGVITGGLFGVGAILLLRRYADRTRGRLTPVFILLGVILLLIAGATIRALGQA